MFRLLLVCAVYLTLYSSVLLARDEDYVIGGEDSSKGRWPWMLSLERLRDDGFGHTCGAALMTPDWILTAAHCLDAQPANEYRVMAGAFNVSAGDYEDTAYLKHIYIHERYNIDLPGIPADIAVAQLERSIDISNPYIGLAKLPRHGDYFPGNKHCYVTGWGRYDSDPNNWEISPTLQELNVPVWTRQECQEMWNNLRPGSGKFIYDQHVCVAGPQTGVCHGDSGSPLNVDMTGHGDWVVAGVASWASGDSCIGATGVYSSAEYFLDWVEEKIPGLPGVQNNTETTQH